jgi:ATP-dependent HslUV protease subunit HslV
MSNQFQTTTIIAVLKDGKAAIAADGQVTFGNTVMKHHSRKIQKLYDGKILAGYAGSAADGLTLLERFDEKINKHDGSLKRAAVELARDWRTDRVLRRLDAMILAASLDEILVLSGTGDIIEPDDGVAAIGSGGPYALAAARAYLESCVSMTARDIVEKSLLIASKICIYTNESIMVESVGEQ